MSVDVPSIVMLPIFVPDVRLLVNDTVEPPPEPDGAYRLVVVPAMVMLPIFVPLVSDCDTEIGA